MAVLYVEVFALAGEDTTPLSPPQQYGVFECFTHALAPLCAPKSAALVVLRCTITTYDTGALISTLCVAASATTATEAIAQRLTAAMAEEPSFFEHWRLCAGQTHIASSDN